MALSLLIAGLLLAVLAAVHGYLWRRLVRDVSRGGPWRRAGTALVVLAAVAGVAVLVSGPDGAPVPVVGVAAAAGYPWLVLVLYLVPALLVGELVRPLLRRGLARRAARRAAPPDTGPPDTARSDTAPSDTGPSAEETVASDGTDPARDPARDRARGPVRDPAGDASRRIFVARTVALGASTLAAGAAGARAVVGDGPGQASGAGAPGVELALPFAGRWRARNSPARRVPSHGTDLLGGRYAIDFVGVDDRHRTTERASWRTLFATEPPEIFYAFGRPVLAPGHGTVVAVHDAEPDHDARRSQFALLPYALGQAGRLRQGIPAVAGNHVIMSLRDTGVFVALVHLKAGSVRVSVGQPVVPGQHLADCGNSGNSTQPHVHIQAMDRADPADARGVPMLFRRFREWPDGPDHGRVRERAMPGEGAVVQALPGTGGD